MDKKIARVLIKLGTPDTSPVKKNVLEDRGTTTRKIKTRSQVVKIPQTQIPDEEGEQYDNESYGEGNLDIGDAWKEVILIDETKSVKEKEKRLQEVKEELYAV